MLCGNEYVNAQMRINFIMFVGHLISDANGTTNSCIRSEQAYNLSEDAYNTYTYYMYATANRAAPLYVNLQGTAPRTQCATLPSRLRGLPLHLVPTPIYYRAIQ